MCDIYYISEMLSPHFKFKDEPLRGITFEWLNARRTAKQTGPKC